MKAVLDDPIKSAIDVRNLCVFEYAHAIRKTKLIHWAPGGEVRALINPNQVPGISRARKTVDIELELRIRIEARLRQHRRDRDLGVRFRRTCPLPSRQHREKLCVRRCWRPD